MCRIRIYLWVGRQLQQKQNVYFMYIFKSTKLTTQDDEVGYDKEHGILFIIAQDSSPGANAFKLIVHLSIMIW